MYIKASEIKSDQVAKEFVDLIDYLSLHEEFGVNTVWQSSKLNRGVYLYKKDELKCRFPETIEILSRYYDDSDIINFYKNHGAVHPIIIDLIGTTGAGKTTFCQQFIDEDSKKLVDLTISRAGQSTVIQTDILILEKTKRKMFLKVRSKLDILKDIFLVATNIDLSIKGKTIASMVKRSQKFYDQDIINKVSSFYSDGDSKEKFISFAESIQNDSKNSGLKSDEWMSENIVNSKYHYIIDDYVDTDEDDFYGYRIEYDLNDNNAENTIITTIGYNVYSFRKENVEAFPAMVGVPSKWLLYDHAILILPCSKDAKVYIDYDFSQGLVFRDSIGHDLDEQGSIASDFEVKNKIFLVPIDTSGRLIDTRYSNLFEKIMISDPKNSIFILTKIDKDDIYKSYKESDYLEDKSFKREFRNKLASTYNGMLEAFYKENISNEGNDEFEKDEKILFDNFMKSFFNCYLSEIESTKGYVADAHKITYMGDITETFDKDYVDIERIDSWFEIVNGILNEHKISFYTNISRLRGSNEFHKQKVVNQCADSLNVLTTFFSDKLIWDKEFASHLSLFSKDYRSFYSRALNWHYSCFRSDASGILDNLFFCDYPSRLIRDVKSYTLKGTKDNYFKTKIVNSLSEYLFYIYNANETPNHIINIADNIISSTFEKAVKISYKAFERNLLYKFKNDNIKIIFDDTTGTFVKPNCTWETMNESLRSYYTITEEYLCIFCNLFAKFKHNLSVYLIDVFKILLNDELNELDKKIK